MDPQHGPPQPDLLIGQTIGNYLVTQKLGEGGMGSVYLAEHPAIGKKVALKVLHSEFSNNQDVTARFFQEAKAVNDIGHPNIVDIVDFGIIQAGSGRGEQLVYFIMEYLAGMTLSQLIRSESPLPPERALTIALQVADALSASHRCGIVHRDLKPDNIILLQRGRERDFVKLLDFGIAKLTGGNAVSSHRTRTGIVMGTPAYMSPEQCEGRDSVDLRTDVYALGIVIYEMLTGRVPFVGEGYGEILVQHLTQRPTPPSQFRMLPPHVEVMVMKALEKRADMRYPTMEEFMRAMSDSVGYVEANGGLSEFLQRPLIPSNAPLPSMRLTPAPMTPLPGTLIAPGLASPVPTTLGTATGQMQAARGRSAYILAGLVVVAAAIAGIIVLVGRDLVGTGSQTAQVTPAATVAAAPLPGSADDNSSARSPVGAPDPVGSAATGSGRAAVAAVVAAGSGAAGSDSPEPPAGSDAARRTDPVAQADASSEITVLSAPSGAKVLVDGTETGQVTPATLSIARQPSRTISISLRLKGYNNFTFRPVDVARSSEQKIELVKVKTGSSVPTSAGNISKPSGSVTKPPGPATKPTGSQDPDGLMRP